MAVHIAIVTAPYDRLILDGSKTVECRLTKTPLPPFGMIAPGQRVYFKRSSGPFFGTAVAERVWMSDALTGAEINRIRRRFGARIQADPAYWAQRCRARYGTLIWLREVRPTALRPAYKAQNMRAWYTLEDAADPLLGANGEAVNGRPFEVLLTPGSLTQNSVRVIGCTHRFPPAAFGGRTRREAGAPVTLRLVGGPTVGTDIVAHQKMFRWRGWRGWFRELGLRAGDRLRFTPLDEGGFAVEPITGRLDGSGARRKTGSARSGSRA